MVRFLQKIGGADKGPGLAHGQQRMHRVLTLEDSYKVKRIRRNPRAICYIGDKEGPQISGTAEIVMGRNAARWVYRAYWKTHRLIMVLIAFSIRRRIETRKQVLIRVHPDEPNPLAGVTDPAV